MPQLRPVIALLATMFAAITSATAQGVFVNFETPQVRPIATATVGGTEYLLACNTPDHFVEIYDANTASAQVAPTFLGRVPVGQGPASVRFDPVTSCFYTANYLGDSVTKVELTSVGGVLGWSLVATKPVGEAPADVAVSADGTTLYVTLADAARLAVLDAATLAPQIRPALLVTASNGDTFAVKEPRRIEIHNGAPWIANMKGGNAHSPHLPDSPTYDLDLWTHDLASSVTRAVGGLGTTNAGMSFGVDGKLYVVGSMARNELEDESTMRDLTINGTGFVESWLWVVDPNGAAPTVTSSRDLNLSAAGNQMAAFRNCSQPMDVALLENGGAVTKVYIATFGSDRLVVLTPNGGPASTWGRSLIGINITPQAGNYGRNGPRGLVINAAKSRLYCLNRLSNSISVVDLATDTEAVRFNLRSDYTPRVVREGRRFLYSAEFSANQTVACSSCHVDGRTDSLGWDLGAPEDGPVQHPVGLDDVIANPNSPPSWHADKGILITQSLQGLVNHPVNRASQDFFSNKPYHWRADRADFKAFNGAFHKLMGMPNIGTAENPMGITDAQMTVYRDFINTVMYTPNPEQALSRTIRGSLGDPANLTTGSGALRGMKAFHTEPINRCSGRSCVQCHWLPDGSNNRITEAGGVGGLETAALRSLFGREGRAEEHVTTNQIGLSNLMTSHFGLTRDGHAHEPVQQSPQFGLVQSGPASIDRFVLDSFQQITLSQFTVAEDIVRFIREFDSGVAPTVGISHSITIANKNSGRTIAAFNLLEDQVGKANCGISVYAQIGGVLHGYYYDLGGAIGGYHLHGTSTVITRAALLNMLNSGDVIVLQGTPAGSERRVASLTGKPDRLSGPAPQNISLQPIRPATHWAPVPQLTKNWDPLDSSANGFNFSSSAGLTPLSIKSVRLLQRGLIQFAPQFGLTQLRHEAPRRFAVSGDDIRLGARLILRIPSPTSAGTPPPYANVNANTQMLDLPLYPTDEFVGGRRVWQTTVEADPLLAYQLMMGGPSATGVAAAVNTPHLVTETMTFPAGTFDPVTWNLHHVTVVNEDRTKSAGSWQPLTMQ